MLRDLLDENDRLPLLVQMACDPQYPIRVGNSRHLARDFGHIMIKEKYMEHFFLMNAIDGVRTSNILYFVFFQVFKATNA